MKYTDNQCAPPLLDYCICIIIVLYFYVKYEYLAIIMFEMINLMKVVSAWVNLSDYDLII